MKINDAHMDENTRKIFKSLDQDQPQQSFTYDVMKKVEKERVYGNWFGDNLWQIVLAVGLPLLYFLFQFLTSGSQSYSQLILSITNSSYFDFIRILSDKLLQDVTLSPFVFMGFVAILLLLVFDRLIIRLLHFYK